MTRALLVFAPILLVIACSSAEPPPPPAATPIKQTAPPAPVANVSEYDHSCPMHPEVTSKGAAKCPKCGMELVAKTATVPTVKISSTPAKPKAGDKTKLSFEVSDGATRLTSFDVVHDKRMHLLMVTPDLAWFQHEHPQMQPDGSFALDFVFPQGGTFRLFSDFKATGKPGAVVPVDINVDGTPSPTVALAASNLSEARVLGDYRVRMTSPVPPAGTSATLKFLVVKNNLPVTDLQPYLGALGHLVIIHEDGKTFLHSHPEDHAAHHDDTGKPPYSHPSTGEVGFATHFAKPGLYKAWAQFLHNGTSLTADFVIDVKPGAATKSADHDHGGHRH